MLLAGVSQHLLHLLPQLAKQTVHLVHNKRPITIQGTEVQQRQTTTTTIIIIIIKKQQQQKQQSQQNDKNNNNNNKHNNNINKNSNNTPSRASHTSEAHSTVNMHLESPAERHTLTKR